MNSNKKGFTLIELMVVLAIIAILFSIVLASTSGAQQNARDDRRVSDMREIQVDLAQYFAAERKYPQDSDYASMLSSLGTVVTDVGDLPASDPTGVAYGYWSTDGTSYCVGAKLEGMIPSDNAGQSGDCANLGSYNYTQLPPQ